MAILYYDINDEGASFMIAVYGTIVRHVMKKDIIGLRTINEDRIKIELSSGKHIYLRYLNINFPSSADIHDLVAQLNAFITNCVCHDSGEEPSD